MEAAPATKRPRVVAIAGGDVAAIEHVLRELPARSGLAYVVVSRIAEPPTSRLPLQSLDGHTSLEPDRVYFVPPGREVVLADGALAVEPKPQARAPADRLMRSLADQLGHEAIGIVVSGDGIDGVFGVKRIKEAGGLTLCQDPTQARLAAMPAAAIATGRVDLVLPVEAIVPELVRLTSELEPEEAPDEAADTLRDILALVCSQTGHDFAPYKRATLHRRIARRMDVCGCPTLVAYHRFLRDHPSELGNLLRDFVISVTSFFRDASVYDALAREVVPRLFEAKQAGDSVRVWVPGCATGEEAYTLAMLLAEHAAALGGRPRIQVFATDIDESGLAIGRAGLYPESIALDIAPSRLERFFDREGFGFRVRKELRELVLFSPHNVLRDPPFSKLDLVSCRNLLIYLDREAQDRVLAIFHFALRAGGFLMTGTSETAETPKGLFDSTGAQARIFERRCAPTAAHARAREPIVRDLDDELLSMHDELRAATAELETRDEELQSANEELTTVNHELKLKVEQLADANSDIDNLVASAGIGIVFLDRNLDIKLFTPRARDLFDLTPSDIGRPLAHLRHQLDLDTLFDEAAKVIRDRRGFEREVRSRGGRSYLLRILPYLSANDRIDGVVLTFLDVTNLQRAEAALALSEQRLALALRSSPMIVAWQDRDLRYTWSYAFGRHLHGPAAPPVLAARAPELDALRREVLATQTSRRVELELEVDGKRRMFDVHIDLADEGVTTVAFDITAAKQAECALRESDRRKDEFLATLSHELRNPLTPLRAALDLQRMCPDQLAATQAIMERQIDQLVGLVDELLDLARVTQGKITLERKRHDARDIVRASADAARSQSAKHELVVAAGDEPILIDADLLRMTQVVSNLLSNAMRFTPDGGHVRVELAADRARGVARLVVRDDGIGIAPEYIDDVFELFVQCRDDRGRARGGGLGIGLNLVRRIVELHGGQVAAHSDGEGRGSELVVEIPLAKE